MPAPDVLLTFLLAALVLCLAPGPDNLFVLAQSALHGQRAGILITCGLCSGVLVHTSAVAFGVAAFFQSSLLAFTLLKAVGALYLAWLAWQAFRASSSPLGSGRSVSQRPLALYRRGVLMNLTNPKVSIFFLAFLPQFASAEQGPLAPQIFVLGSLFILVALLVFFAIALLAGRLGQWLQQTPRAQLWLNRLAGTVFAALALKLATSSQH